MTIAILCPSRGRAKQCNRMIQSVYSTTETPVNIYISASETEFLTYKETIDMRKSSKVKIILMCLPDIMPTAFKWNKLAEYAQKDGCTLFALSADDTVFSTPLWDKALVDHYNALDIKIHAYHLRDSRNEEGTPHPIVTKEYIEAMGYFLPPLFLHWHVDTWTIAMAKHAGCFTHIKDYMLLHDKPSDRGDPDETHNRIRVGGWHDRDMWTHQKCGHLLEVEKKRLWDAVVREMTIEQRNKAKVVTI